MKSGIKKLMVAMVSLFSAISVIAGNWVNFSNYSEVTSIALRNGNEVWVAAKGGLLMYDQTSGEKTFFKKGPTELPSLSVERVLVHPLTNDVWIGTYDNGIAFVHNGTWTHIPFPEHEAMLYEMKIATDGAVWAATTRGLYCYKNSQFYSYLTVPMQGNPMCWDFDFMANGKILAAHFTPFIFNPVNNQVQILPSSTFAYSHSTVTVKNDSVFYFATDHGDLAEYHDTTEVDTFHVGGIVEDIVFSAAGDKLLLETNNIIQLINGVFSNWNVASGTASAITASVDGFWVGSREDYAKMMKVTTLGQVTPIDIRRTDIYSNWVTEIGASADGNVLLSLNNGIQKYDLATRTFTSHWDIPGTFIHLNEALELNGKLYAGTSVNYLYEFATTDSFRVLGNGVLPDNEVQHLDKDAQGNLWLCGPGYIAKYDGSTFTVYTSTNNANLTTNLYLRDIHCDVTRNVVWVTSYDGIFKIQNGVVSFYNENTPGIQQYYDVVEVIAEDAQHNIWFGTVYGGIIRYDGTNFSTMLLPETKGNQFVTGIAFDGSAMYVSDNLHGIWKYENAQWDSLTENNSRLSSNYVTALHMDSEGNLWAGNLSYGVDVYNKNGVSLAVKDAIKERIYTTYPNPSHGIFVIEGASEANMELEVFSTDGQLVHRSSEEGSKAIIQLQGQPPGMYICKVKSAAGSQTLKLIIE